MTSDSEKKKLRGLKRKMRLMRALPGLLEDFDPCPIPGLGYWYMKIPMPWAALEGPKAKPAVRLECVRLMIESSIVLGRSLSGGRAEARSFCVIRLPRLFDSELIVHFERGFLEEKIRLELESDGPEYWYEPLPEERSLIEEWRLDTFEGVRERGLLERIEDESGSRTGEVWYVGDV